MSIHAAIAGLIIALFAAPLYAQHPAHPEIVQEMKAMLETSGFDLRGACGAFKITQAVAWRLQGEGVGLLDKPGGNQCLGYAVDFLTYADGSGVDILGDAGGANTPGWDLSEPPGALLGRWREPLNPDGVVVVPPPVTLPPPNPGYDVDVIQRLMRIENQQLIASLKLDTLAAQLKAHDEDPSWLMKVFSNRYVQLALATLATWQVTKE